MSFLPVIISVQKYGASSYKCNLEIPQHVIYILQKTQMLFVNINKGFLDPKPFVQDFSRL